MSNAPVPPPQEGTQPVTAPVDLPEAQALLEQAVGVPFVDGNQVTVLTNGDEIFPAMLEAIEAARYRIDFATYVYWQGDIANRFAEALANRARAGVRVRVLLDAHGSARMESKLLRLLRQAGALVQQFRPLSLRPWRWDKRTHRKLLICDDSAGFTGGVGIAREWEGDARTPQEWRETHLRLRGPAVVGLRSAFLDNWNEAAPWQFDPLPSRPEIAAAGVPVQVVRSSTSVGWTEAATLIRSLISIAQREVRITTAYFNPDPRLVQLLRGCCERGVRLRLLVPGPYCDSRLSQLAGHWAVEALLRSGAEISEYQRTMLHAKVMTVDGLYACVGSANLNHRSMAKDEECCVVIRDQETAATLDCSFDKDLAHSQAIELDPWARRSPWLRLQESAARLMTEQL